MSAPQKRTRSWEVDVTLEELVSWDVLDQFMGDMPTEPIQPDQASSSGAAPALPVAAPSSWPACGGAGPSAAPEAGHPTAASLAQSFYSDWQQGVPWQGALPGVGMPRAMSWGTEFLSGTLGGDEGMGMVNADPDADDAAAGRVSPRMGDGGAGERSHSTVTRQARPTTYAVTQQPTAATQQRPLSGWGCPLEAGRPRRRLQLQLRGRRWMEEGCGLRRPSDGSVQHTGPPTSSGLCGRLSCIIDLRRRSTH